ncbi:hypothetical protein [Micromonospora sp. NPDC007230]|uniref:hypothetical protein n=1 Tax=Micromonospora sp. NPDC007230 TaxID=3364237 RepID=UPI00368D0AB5
MAAPNRAATRETISRPDPCGQAPPRPRRSIPQMLRRRSGDLTTAHVADACLRAGVPVHWARVGPWTVDAGDGALADEDGALVVPADRVGEVFDLAESIRDAERRQADRRWAGEPPSAQISLGAHLAARAENPALTFRKHLRAVGGAIEE